MMKIKIGKLGKQSCNSPTFDKPYSDKEIISMYFELAYYNRRKSWIILDRYTLKNNLDYYTCEINSIKNLCIIKKHLLDSNKKSKIIGSFDLNCEALR